MDTTNHALLDTIPLSFLIIYGYIYAVKVPFEAALLIKATVGLGHSLVEPVCIKSQKAS